MFENFDPWGSDKIDNKKNSFEILMNSKVMSKKDIDKTYARINKATELHKLPLKNQQIRVITQKAFTSTDFLVWIADKEKILELNMAVYRMNNKSSSILISLQYEHKFELNIVLSSIFKNAKKAEAWHNHVVQFAKETKNVYLIYIANHAKVFSIRTENNFYTIEGSGNMSANANIEQYTLDNCEKVYDFHSLWIKELTRKS